MTLSNVHTKRSKLIARADELFENTHYSEALAIYQEIISIIPDDVEALTGIATSYDKLGKNQDAIECLLKLRRWLPESTELLVLLGDAYLRERKYEEAKKNYHDVVTLSPDSAIAYFQLGRIAMDTKNPTEAFEYFSQAIEKNPEYTDAYGHLGVLLSKHCRYAEAEKALLKALDLQPDYMLGINNLGSLYKMQGQLDKAYKWYQKGMVIDPKNPTIVSNFLFGLINDPSLTPEKIAAEHRRLSNVFDPSPDELLPPLPKLHANHDRTRLGYISGDFYNHSVGYFIEPVLMNHDQNNVEVYCYSSCNFPDETTRRMMALPLVWRDVNGMSATDVARLIRDDEIDILIELSGHTADNSLKVCALRPAPIQASWIGYPATTGLDQIDYYITDAICDPPGETEHLYSEKVCRLPEVFSCYLPPIEFPPVSPPSHEHTGSITFCCFNSFAKVSEKLLVIWAEILARVPDSQLYLKSMPLGDLDVKERIYRIFGKNGISEERLIMRSITSTPLEHLSEYSRADIALDTFPYNGTTTTCEALWMGVPVVTLAGSSHASRVGMSFLNSIGCEDTIAYTAEEYIERAVMLAHDRQKLSILRKNLRRMMAHSPLMNGQQLAHNLEEACKKMVVGR